MGVLRIVLCLTLLTAAACGDVPAQTAQEASPPAPEAGTPTPVLFIPVTEPDHPDVVVRSGAAGPPLECEHGPYLGSTASNYGGPSGAPTAEDGLTAFAAQGLFQVPRDGYREVARSQERVMYVFEVDEQVRVAVVIARAGVSDQVWHEDGWAVETFAMCDPSEFGYPPEDPHMAGIWYDEDGVPQPTRVINSLPGHEHCDTQTVTFLSLGEEQFVRDPDGVVAAQTVTTFDASAELPDDARDTGYRKGGAALWRAADGSAVYLVATQGVERWPASRELIACR